MTAPPNGGSKTESLKEHLRALRPLQEALRAKQLRPQDTRTARQLVDELHDEFGLPK